jgi:hypothetical protein
VTLPCQFSPVCQEPTVTEDELAIASQ